MKKENKNIERLFQEKFKDFEVSPPDFVWENIQEKLHPKEKKRRVIPFWFKTAGIAASFVALFSVIFYNLNTEFKNTTVKNNNAVVNSETNKNNSTSHQNVNGTKSSNSSEFNVNNPNSTVTNEAENNSKTNNSLVNNTSTNNSSNSKTNIKLNKDTKLNTGSLQNSNPYKSNTGFVSNTKKQSKTSKSIKSKTLFQTSNSGIAASGTQRNKINTKQKSTTESIDFNSLKINKSNSGVADVNPFHSNQNNSYTFDNTDFNSVKNNNSNSSISDKNIPNSSTVDSQNNTNTIVGNDLENANTTTNSTTYVVVEDVTLDTITLATVILEENPMEKLLREKETKKVVDEKEKWSKWAVNSYISPVFFNSFSNGSPLSDEFAANEKTFNTSASYGVGVAYNINKRLTVKTGISNLNLDFDTENIAFYSSFEDQSKISNTNIERNANGKYLVLRHEKDPSKEITENLGSQSNQNLGNLNQRTQYIEVPVEMSYAILNKKIGVAIRGGMSTLFLTENEVSIKAADGNMQIGKASNLNEVHFSSNVGLGFSYNFMKNFQLNVEPTLKYQINTFNKNSEDFTPYVVGINTGISYKF
jgi:hypothetical protein